MDTPKSTQNSSDSGCYFDSSHSLFESTPNRDNDSTPLSFTVSRKRKASYFEGYNARKLADVIESCPASPQFSSTFNESLTNNLRKFHIEAEDSYVDEEGVTNASKIFRSSGNYQKKVRSAPSTPERQVTSAKDKTRANTSSYVKTFEHINVQSPLNKDAYDILYPSLPPLEPKRAVTPQTALAKIVTPAKKCLFSTSRHELFRKVFTNVVIVSNIFTHLSDGDLYRLSKVSRPLKDALGLDLRAYDRYRKFAYQHRRSKENYRITPPKSPQHNDSFAGASPGSKNFYYFCNIASDLTRSQSLVKCPRCSKASVVENSIGQCQDVNSCGYIFCQKCNSFANNPKDFKDKCNNAQLVNIRSRSRLGDLSNSTATSDANSSFFSSSCLNLSLSNKYDSSGFFSEGENTPVQAVKRNLSRSFMVTSEVKSKVLSSNNSRVVAQATKPPRRSSVLPVVQSDSTPKRVEIIEPSSPPKIKPYSACSRQSKRNLKRLTR